MCTFLSPFFFCWRDGGPCERLARGIYAGVVSNVRPHRLAVVSMFWASRSHGYFRAIQTTRGSYRYHVLAVHSVMVWCRYIRSQCRRMLSQGAQVVRTQGFCRGRRVLAVIDKAVIHTLICGHLLFFSFYGGAVCGSHCVTPDLVAIRKSHATQPTRNQSLPPPHPHPRPCPRPRPHLNLHLHPHPHPPPLPLPNKGAQGTVVLRELPCGEARVRVQRVYAERPAFQDPSVRRPAVRPRVPLRLPGPSPARGARRGVVVLSPLRQGGQPGGVQGLQGRRGLRQAVEVRRARVRLGVAHVSFGVSREMGVVCLPFLWLSERGGEGRGVSLSCARTQPVNVFFFR